MKIQRIQVRQFNLESEDKVGRLPLSSFKAYCRAPETKTEAPIPPPGLPAGGCLLGKGCASDCAKVVSQSGRFCVHAFVCCNFLYILNLLQVYSSFLL